MKISKNLEKHERSALVPKFIQWVNNMKKLQNPSQKYQQNQLIKFTQSLKVSFYPQITVNIQLDNQNKIIQNP